MQKKILTLFYTLIFLTSFTASVSLKTNYLETPEIRTGTDSPLIINDGVTSGSEDQLLIEPGVNLGGGYVTFQNSQKYYFGGSEVSDSSGTGLMLKADTNPGSGEPLLIVESSGGSERLRVEHDGTTSTTNNLHAQGEISTNTGLDLKGNSIQGADTTTTSRIVDRDQNQYFVDPSGKSVVSEIKAPLTYHTPGAGLVGNRWFKLNKQSGVESIKVEASDGTTYSAEPLFDRPNHELSIPPGKFPVTITIDFGGNEHYNDIGAIGFRYYRAVNHVKAEAQDDADEGGDWHVITDKDNTGNKNQFIWSSWGSHKQKFRLTLSDPTSTAEDNGEVRISNLAQYSSIWKRQPSGGLVYAGGDTMYGDLDLNSNSLVIQKGDGLEIGRNHGYCGGGDNHDCYYLAKTDGNAPDPDGEFVIGEKGDDNNFNAWMSFNNPGEVDLKGNKLRNTQVAREECRTYGWTSWDDGHGINCGEGYLVGMRSYHDNDKEDRRYVYKCCFPESSDPSTADRCSGGNQDPCKPDGW